MPNLNPRSRGREILSRAAALLVVALALGGCGGSDDTSTTSYAELASSVDITINTVPSARARLLAHTMPVWSGGSTTATTLLFTPRGTPPSGGWPIVAWAHGTTTASYRNCAPSGTLDTLDGGLTAEGFTSRYAEVISYLVSAGYAVVAPDFEGLGTAASAPYPYYNSASESRSLLAAVKAARQADSSLSNKWVAVGHSEGGRGVLALQGYLDEAPELDYRGTVALAPFTSLAAAVDRLALMKTSDPANARLYAGIQNFFVAMLTTGLNTVSPGVDRTSLMGSDLSALMPTFGQHCIFSSFGIVSGAVAANAGFDGFKVGWSNTTAMKAFLEANDPAAVPGFTVRPPTLIVQGTNDVFVLEPLTSAFVDVQTGRGAPVSYRLYPGADHGSIVIDAKDAVLSYLAGRFSN